MKIVVKPIYLLGGTFDSTKNIPVDVKRELIKGVVKFLEMELLNFASAEKDCEITFEYLKD